MDFIPVRDFRIRPASVWRRLRKNGKAVVTSNGKPVALLTDMEGRDLEEELKTQAYARGWAAVTAMRRQAKARGLDKMTMEEIDEEIAAARRERR